MCLRIFLYACTYFHEPIYTRLVCKPTNILTNTSNTKLVCQYEKDPHPAALGYFLALEVLSNHRDALLALEGVDLQVPSLLLV